MRELKTWAWAAAVAAATAAPAAAQQSTVTTTTGGPTGTTLTGSSLTGTGSTTQSSGVGSGAGSSSSNSSNSGTPPTETQAPPKLTAPTGKATSSLQKSNFLSGYYANPYFQGISTQPNAVPGGFGMALYGNATGTGGVNSGGRGTAGAAGTGGRAGQSNANLSGIVVPSPVQINYAAQMRFPTPPVAAGRMQADLRAAIDGAASITNPKTVLIVLDPANNVTLRGTVRDDDEARLAEGLVRLTPGVGAITNELTFPVAGK